MGEIGRWAVIIAALTVTAFQIWKSLKPDFPQAEIFSFIWRLLICGTFGAVLARGEIWGVILGGVVIAWWWAKKMAWDAWELGDILMPNIMLFGLMSGLVFGVRAWLNFLFYGLGLLVMVYFKAKYRQFSWYKSGRAGLILLSGLVWTGIAEIAIALFTGDGVYYILGLSAGQLVASWLISFGIIGIILRSWEKNLN